MISFTHHPCHPETLLAQLENVNLTDEDADILLKEAYALNKRLKEELKSQEEDSRQRHPPRGRQLPPLHSANLPRGVVSLYTATPTTAHTRKKSSPNATRSPSGSPKRTASAVSTASTSRKASSGRVKDKPVWDDRFSYK